MNEHAARRINDYLDAIETLMREADSVTNEAWRQGYIDSAQFYRNWALELLAVCG